MGVDDFDLGITHFLMIFQLKCWGVRSLVGK